MNKNLTGNIPENLIIFCNKKTLEKSYWDDFDMDEDCEGMEVLRAFATDAKNKKTQETARSWSRGPGFQKIEKPNAPMKNLRIVSLEKRCEGGMAWKVLTEDNLWFDLREDVLLDSLQNESVKNGILGGVYVFAVVGSQMKIIRVGSELHKRVSEYMNRKATKEILVKDLKAGHIYANKKGKKFIFLGKWDAIVFDRYYGEKSVKKFDHCLLIAIDTCGGKVKTLKDICDHDISLVKTPAYIEDLGEFKDYEKIIPKLTKSGIYRYRQDVQKYGEKCNWAPSPCELFNGRPAGDSKVIYGNYGKFIEAMKNLVTH